MYALSILNSDEDLPSFSKSVQEIPLWRLRNIFYGNWETWIPQLLQVHSRIYTITATGLHSILFGKTTKVYWRDRNWKTHRSCTEREISQMRITSYKNSILLNLSIIHVISSNVVSFSIHIAVSGYNFNSYLFSLQTL